MPNYLDEQVTLRYRDIGARYVPWGDYDTKWCRVCLERGGKKISFNIMASGYFRPRDSDTSTLARAIKQAFSVKSGTSPRNWASIHNWDFSNAVCRQQARRSYLYLSNMQKIVRTMFTQQEIDYLCANYMGY